MMSVDIWPMPAGPPPRCTPHFWSPLADLDDWSFAAELGTIEYCRGGGWRERRCHGGLRHKPNYHEKNCRCFDVAEGFHRILLSANEVVFACNPSVLVRELINGLGTLFLIILLRSPITV